MDIGMSDVPSGLPLVSLSELDQRAALLRRVDDKYAVEVKRFRELTTGSGND
jgi:hypothetical protein